MGMRILIVSAVAALRYESLHEYDPDNSHFDRISMDVLDVRKTMAEIKKLEAKINSGAAGYEREMADYHESGWWDQPDLDTQTLKSLKESIGLDPNAPISGDFSALNVTSAIEEAAASHG